MDVKEAKKEIKAEPKMALKIDSAEDPDFSKKKFKPEDIEKFEVYDDSSSSNPSKRSGLFGLKKSEKKESSEKSLGQKKDFEELPLKNKKIDIFGSKSKPFDDSIETYDKDSSSKKATFIAILVVVGILAILLLFKSAGIIGYSVKDVSDKNATGGDAKASQKQGLFGFNNIDTVNLSKEPQGTFVSEECLGKINNSEADVAQLEDEILLMRQESQDNYNQMLQLIKHYQDYYQEKINEQSKDITSAEEDLDAAKEKLGEMRDKCYADN